MVWVLGIIILMVKLLIVLVVLLLVAAYLVYVERRLLGFMQLRLGPNRCGPQGLLQPLADAVKLLTKEDFIPAGADRVIFLYAPAVVAGTALLIFAVVPFAQGWTFRGQEIPGVISDLNVGLLFVLALSSLGVYGVALGGWASNSKFALLGAIRAAAQMISYELSLGLSLAPVVMLARSFSLVDIVQAQARLPVHPLAAPGLPHFFHQRRGRNEAHPLRPARRPKTSWWPAITWNTAACASGSIFWESTSPW